MGSSWLVARQEWLWLLQSVDSAGARGKISGSEEGMSFRWERVTLEEPKPGWVLKDE